jgi:hypothetical protein
VALEAEGNPAITAILATSKLATKRPRHVVALPTNALSS